MYLSPGQYLFGENAELDTVNQPPSNFSKFYLNVYNQYTVT